MMNTRLLLAIPLGVLLTAAPAQAALFTLDSYSVTLRDIDPGLVLWETDLSDAPNSGTALTFDLDAVGETYETSLFRIGTNESALNLDDVVPFAISVNFDFSTPLPGFEGDAQGLTGAAWLFGSFGYAIWDNPLILNFTGGQLAVYLESVTFGLPGYTDVNAKFMLTRLDPLVTSVPEPATLAMFGVGAVALAAFRRRRAEAV
jgi:hypothetical protein